MKKCLLIFLLAPLLLLPACTAAAEPPPTSTAAPAPAAAPTTSPEFVTAAPLLSAVDYQSCQSRLSGEDWAALESWLPILTGGGSFRFQFGVPETPELASTTLRDLCAHAYRDAFGGTEDGLTFPPEFSLSAFTLCDMDGDGEKELILDIPDLAGWYLVLHREGGQPYAAWFYVRAFQLLYDNGVHSGSSSAFTTYYMKLRFENGVTFQDILASEDGWDREHRYHIGGSPATPAEYEDWLAGNLSGEAVWYP